MLSPWRKSSLPYLMDGSAGESDRSGEMQAAETGEIREAKRCRGKALRCSRIASENLPILYKIMINDKTKSFPPPENGTRRGNSDGQWRKMANIDGMGKLKKFSPGKV